MSRTALTFSLAFCFNTAQAGIPVFDGTAIAQAVLQVQAWAQQYQQMAQQFGKLNELKDMATGSRGMGLILNDPAVKAVLPADWQNVIAAIKSTTLYSAARAKYPVLAGNPTQNAVYDQLAAQSASMTDLFTKANGRIAQVESLLGQINNASDPAAKQDLNNRLINEQNSIAATSQLVEILDSKYQQNLAEAEHAAYLAYQCKEFGRTGC